MLDFPNKILPFFEPFEKFLNIFAHYTTWNSVTQFHGFSIFLFISQKNNSKLRLMEDLLRLITQPFKAKMLIGVKQQNLRHYEKSCQSFEFKKA